MDDTLLKIDDVLRLSTLSRATLYRLIKEGKFPAPIKFKSASRWKESDVNEWINNQPTD